jgi:hypothetical protein
MVCARMTIDWVKCKSCLCSELLFARGLGTPESIRSRACYCHDETLHAHKGICQTCFMSLLSGLFAVESRQVQY